MIDIVTLTYRNVHELEDTVLSVTRHLKVPYNLIIIDGANDAARIYSNKYQVVSNSHGISVSFNEGIRRKKYDWTIFLNSGDRLIQDITKSMLNPNYSILVFKALYSNGKVIDAKKLEKYGLQGYWPHQATIYKGNLQYNESLQIRMDYHLNLRLIKARQPVLVSSEVLSLCDCSGVSARKKFRYFVEGILVSLAYLKIRNALFEFYIFIKKLLRND